MYELLSKLLSDQKGGVVFTCFDIWHLGYIALTVGAIALMICLFRKSSVERKNRVERIFIGIAFGLYVADFFLMPFAYAEIDVEKLPFHACTAMCVMCFLSNHVAALKKYRLHFAMLGLISNLIYVFYPAGIMWYEIHPLSYRAVQTLLFHGAMSAYGLLTVIFNWRELEIKRCYRDLLLLIAMTVWATLGNALYSGETEEYSRYFNWFFVRQDPLNILPAEIAHYVSPFLNIAVFFAVDIVIYLVCKAVGKAALSDSESVSEN